MCQKISAIDMRSPIWKKWFASHLQIPMNITKLAIFAKVGDQNRTFDVFCCSQGKAIAEWVHIFFTLRWRHNGCHGVSHYQPRDCLLNLLFRHRSNNTSELRVTGLCARNSPHKGPVTRKMFPFDDIIMTYQMRFHELFVSQMWGKLPLLVLPFHSLLAVDLVLLLPPKDRLDFLRRICRVFLFTTMHIDYVTSSLCVFTIAS